MCVELQRVNFDPKNQSWSFWSHNHETSMKMWKRALIFGRELALVTWTSTPKNESWSFWSHKHETSIKMWKRALIFGRERALVTWNSTSKTDCVEHPPTFSNHVIAEIAMCVELQRVNFDPKNQSWSFWSHETSMKMWKRALLTWTSTPKNESINTKQASR